MRKTARVASFGTAQAKETIDLIGRHLARRWYMDNGYLDMDSKQSALNSIPDAVKKQNPYSIGAMKRIKREFEQDEQATKDKYPEIFYYFDGIVGMKISQSVHPAGMVISPITLDDNFGTFEKDGETCLMFDMDNVHDYTGLAKFDFLVLKTVQVIDDTCKYLNLPYPKSHEVDWDDVDVWESVSNDATCVFQMESTFAANSLKKFRPRSIFDMSLVTACIRPTGASYRNDLLAHKVHHNPSKAIDDLLKNNLGYLVYQEDTIAFLQQICGLSGSEADEVRRSIGRKDRARLDRAMPDILDGYCRKSPRPREEAEQEAKEFMQILIDSASYQFGLMVSPFFVNLITQGCVSYA